MLEKSCLKDMEIGNLLWGNSRGEFQVPRGEWQDKFQEFLEETGFSPKGHIEAPSLKKWEITKEFVVLDDKITGMNPDEIRRIGERTETAEYIEEYKIGTESYRIVKDWFFENSVFFLRPYYWGDLEEIAEQPNFIFKPSDFIMSWYKWPLRDACCNKDIDYDWFLKMIKECKKSLQEA